MIIASALGLAWGLFNQFLPALLNRLPGSSLYRDAVISLLWIVLLIALLVALGPGKPFLYLALIGAVFWMSSTAAYYMYYLAMLAQARGPIGIPFLWNFAKHTLLKWLFISAVGGSAIGVITGLLFSRASKKAPTATGIGQ